MPTISARWNATGWRRCTTRACCAYRTGWWITRSPNGCIHGALDAVRHARQFAPVVILSDGDAVFQPRKVERSGLSKAFDGHVLIYIHKEEELDDVERLYPARHYVMIDDKLRILDTMKKIWGERVTTVFPRQGHYATDPEILAQYPHGDIQLNRIGDLVNHDLSDIQKR